MRYLHSNFGSSHTSTDARGFRPKVWRQTYPAKDVQTHPEKGGCAHEFQKRLIAYHVLSNRTARAAYHDTRYEDQSTQRSLLSAAIRIGAL